MLLENIHLTVAKIGTISDLCIFRAIIEELDAYFKLQKQFYHVMVNKMRM